MRACCGFAAPDSVACRINGLNLAELLAYIRRDQVYSKRNQPIILDRARYQCTWSKLGVLPPRSRQALCRSNPQHGRPHVCISVVAKNFTFPRI
jgi:hypothetical protein